MCRTATCSVFGTGSCSLATDARRLLGAQWLWVSVQRLSADSYFLNIHVAKRSAAVATLSNGRITACAVEGWKETR